MYTFFFKYLICRQGSHIKLNRIKESETKVDFVLFIMILNATIPKISMRFTTSASDFTFYVIVLKYISNNIALRL